MSLKFKSLEQATKQPIRRSPPQHGALIGQPIGMPGLPARPIRRKKKLPPLPSAGLKRAVNYYADYAGCGWWRMIQPELLLNLEQRGVINGLTTMVVEPKFYQGLSTIRLQRQATPVQLEFMKFLKKVAQTHNYKVIYEIDDIIFKDDIPDFNRCKAAFVEKDILSSSIEMMQLSDEISVTCQFMKDYYIAKTGNKNITIIPNYPSKMWFGGYYNRERILENFNKNKKRPRIAYIGSGTHIDVGNIDKQHDDFFHVVDNIIKTRHMFKWIFVGAYPLKVKKYIDAGEMEFKVWIPLKDLPTAYTETNCQAVVAPLKDCTFNKAKSNIKYLEAACCGIPGVFQDLITYVDAPLRFTTGDEMIDQLQKLLKSTSTYMTQSDAAYAYANTMWLDDHLDEYSELYFTKIGEPDRKALLLNNPDQVSTKSYTNSLLN